LCWPGLAVVLVFVLVLYLLKGKPAVARAPRVHTVYCVVKCRDTQVEWSVQTRRLAFPRALMIQYRTVAKKKVASQCDNDMQMAGGTHNDSCEFLRDFRCD